MSKRKIIAITGARSDYDLLFSVYEKLNKDDDIDFGVIITGPHLSDKYGYTAQYVEADGFHVVSKIFNLIDSDQKIGRAASIGNQILTLSSILNHEQPDMVLVAGDREEAISVSLTCAYLDIIVCHFFGGDIAKDGNIDNSTRYAASKYAHIHFVTLPQHKENLMRLGEEENRIFIVGNPALDRIVSTSYLNLDSLSKKMNIDRCKYDNYCVLIQHSIITETDKQSFHIRETLNSILESDLHCFVNYPNTDAGALDIIKAYDEYIVKYPEKFTLFKNLDRLVYVNLLRSAEFLIGNSSSGIVEVASFGLPAINIGSRQRGRIHGDNVIFVDNKKSEIKNAIKKTLTDHEFRAKVKLKNNPYGDGDSSDKVVEIIKNIRINKQLIYKNITY